VLVDYKTGFAVGPDGSIIRGLRDRDGNWSWASVSPKPTLKHLNSIAFAEDTLWVVGDWSTILSSRDLGKTWQAHSPENQPGRPPSFKRVRYFYGEVWIAGSGVVYRFSPAK
jgi:photosystem II stability/assembly factor-like uncharacterized protein